MPLTKFQLNPAYCLGGDVVLRFSRWPTWRPACISERNQFSNSKYECGPNASHKVCAQSDRFGSKCRFKIFKMAPRRPSWISKRNGFGNSECLCRSDASRQVSAQSNLHGLGDVIGRIPNGHHGGHLGYRNGMILAILNFYIALMLPIKFRLNPTYSLGGYAV